MKYKVVRVIMLVFIVVLLPLACGPTQYALNTSVSPGGSGTATPAGGTYDAGTEVTLVAEPASGYAFDHWSGDATGTTSSVAVTMDSDKSVTAYFNEKHTLAASVSPSGGGTVSPDSGTYDAGTKVTLTASAAEGYDFDHWSGDASGTSSPVAIIIDRDKNIVANFKVASEAPSEIGNTLSALEAQQAVQTALNVMGNAINIEGLPGPQLPNGAEVPKNARAGTPTLVEINGVPAWKVPVLSNGVRIGEIYVKQIQSTPNRIEFINFGQYGPTRVETEYRTYR